MNNKPTHLREKVPHITKAAPYSLHKTYFTNHQTPSLYLHFHPECELLYLAEGSMEVAINNTTYQLNAKEALFLPPNVLHSAISNSCSGTFHAVVFSENILSVAQPHISSYLSEEPDNSGYVCKLSDTVDWQKELLLYLRRIFFSHEMLLKSEVYIQSHILIIWEYLYHYHISSKLTKEKPNTPIKEVLDYIHTHYQEDLTLESLSKIAHMSKEHLCRMFKKSTGQTPVSYLKQYRILKSCYYLKETDKKISEICFLVGFNNISYFNREFLRILQTTPSNYRSRD